MATGTHPCGRCGGRIVIERAPFEDEPEGACMQCGNRLYTPASRERSAAVALAISEAEQRAHETGRRARRPKIDY